MHATRNVDMYGLRATYINVGAACVLPHTERHALLMG